MSLFKPATRKKLKARIAICGPAKGGKSYTGLRFVFALANYFASQMGRAPRVACIDTENRSLSKYQGESPDGIPFNFDVVELAHFDPQQYIDIIKTAEREGYDALLIDSLSHAWTGTGGALEKVDNAKGSNKFTDGWRDVTPLHNRMIDAIVRANLHIICTMRTSMEYILEEVNGKKVPRKVGMKPVQRAGMEYEFDCVADVDEHHTMRISGSRCRALDGKSATTPGLDFIQPIFQWLDDGEAPEQPELPASTSIAPEVVPAGMVVSTSPPRAIEDKAEVIASIMAKMRDLKREPAKIVEWARAYQPGATTLEKLTLAHLEDLNRKLTDAVQAIGREKAATAMAYAQASLKPSDAKIAQMIELSKEYNGPDHDMALESAIKKRGMRQPSDWTDAEVDETISKLKSSLDKRDMEEALTK